MLIHGSTDSVVDLSDSTDIYKRLVDLGVPSELHIYSEEEHAFDSQSGYGRSVAELQNLFLKSIYKGLVVVGGLEPPTSAL